MIKSAVSASWVFALCVTTACAVDANETSVENGFGAARAESVVSASGDVSTTLLRAVDGTVLGTATWTHADQTQAWSVDGVSGLNVVDPAPTPYEQGLLLEAAWTNTPAGRAELASQPAPSANTQYLAFSCEVQDFGPYCQASSCIGGGFFCTTILCPEIGWGSCDYF